MKVLLCTEGKYEWMKQDFYSLSYAYNHSMSKHFSERSKVMNPRNTVKKKKKSVILVAF